MDRRRIHKQLAKKVELESQFIKPRETLTGGGSYYELNIKPSSTKSGAGQMGNDFIYERPPKFSISTTNLKIKKAHATTLSDFFSQQREQHLGLQKAKQVPTPLPQNRTTDSKQSRPYLKKNNNDLLNQNPMNFYHRNSNAIVQHILKKSESQVLNMTGRNHFESSHNQLNKLDENPDLMNNNNAKPNSSSYPNSSLRNTTQLNPLRNLAALTSSKPAVHFQEQVSQEQQEQNSIKENIISDPRNANIHHQYQVQSSQGNRSNFSRDNAASTQDHFLPSAGRNSTSQKMQRTYQSKFLDKKRDEIYNPKKFYCLSSVGFKNYKYPRPIEMPYEKESEKLTRMPLYLLPQSAPSKEIEDICINKYQTEVQELEQSIVEKQQSIQQNSQQEIVQQVNGKFKNGDYFQLQDLESMKVKYLNEIGYLQNKATSLSKKRKFKTTAKYTFSDSKSKDLNKINMRSNRIEDISDKLFRNKNKIEEQMAITKANITRLQTENSSYLQQSMSMQNKVQINQTVQQLYKELVFQSDQLKSNHKYTEEYRQRLEEEDEEGVEADEYCEYDEDEENFDEEDPEQYKIESDRNKKKKRSSEFLQQKELGQQESGYIQEETEEEFQNENSSYKLTETQLQQQINAQEEYINKYINQNPSSTYYNKSSSDGLQLQVPSDRNYEQIDDTQEEQANNYEREQQIQQQQNQQQQQEEAEEEDQIRIHSLADFKNTQPLTDKDIIQKRQLMMNVLIDTFTVLKHNRPALRNRILLSLGLNPQDVFQSVTKEVFKFFYEVLISKTATLESNIKFIIKFFKLEDEEEEEYILNDLKDKDKIKELEKQKTSINKDEFKRILRILTISIDEKTKPGDKSLYDYMVENLTLTEVLQPNEQSVDLEQFKMILMEGKINPKDIIDLICNLQ